MERNRNYFDFIEDEKRFYLAEAGFNEREKQLFILRAYEGKTLWDASEIMGYSSRTIDRINRRIKRKIEKASFIYDNQRCRINDD